MGSEITNSDLFSRLAHIGCQCIQFDVAEMITPESLWQFPVGWKQVSHNNNDTAALFEMITTGADNCIIFVSKATSDKFAPTAVASVFQVAGPIDPSRLFSDLQDIFPQEAINEHTESDVLINEPDYTLAHILSTFSAPVAAQVIDFQSKTVFDLYQIKYNHFILLQRTIIAPQHTSIPLPVFNDARPPEEPRTSS